MFLVTRTANMLQPQCTATGHIASQGDGKGEDSAHTKLHPGQCWRTEQGAQEGIEDGCVMGFQGAIIILILLYKKQSDEPRHFA